MKFIKKSMFVILPMFFFSIWAFGCMFVEWSFIPSEMTSTMRFVIVWFGLSFSILGFYLAALINNKL